MYMMLTSAAKYDGLCIPSTASGRSCCTTVLLTERCHTQSLMLKRLLERTGQPLPPLLEKMAQDVLKVCCWLYAGGDIGCVSFLDSVTHTGVSSS